MTVVPDDLRYSEDHLWVRSDSVRSRAQIGITDYAQDSLGDIVVVTLPAIGQSVTFHQAFGEIESTKAISDLIAPLNGIVRACNDGLTDAPELINSDPYGQGWLLELDIDLAHSDSEVSALLDAAAYRS